MGPVEIANNIAIWASFNPNAAHFGTKGDLVPGTNHTIDEQNLYLVLSMIVLGIFIYCVFQAPRFFDWLENDNQKADFKAWIDQKWGFMIACMVGLCFMGVFTVFGK